MEMSDVAGFFDQDPVYDLYTGDYLFDAQTASFDDSASDGSTNRRRVISTTPDIVMPPRRGLMIYEEAWLVGEPTTDGFQGDMMRKNFAMRRSTGIMAIMTPGEAANAAPATQTAHAHKLWYRDVSSPNYDSDMDTFWNISFAPAENLREGQFLRDEIGTLFRVRRAYLPIQGLTIAQSDELDGQAFVALTFNTPSGVYDPASDSYTGVSVTGTGILVDTLQLFRNDAESDPTVKAGDRSLIVAQSLVTPKQGDTVTFNGLTWNILKVQVEGDSWLLRVRR